MPNLSVTYTEAGQSAIDNMEDITVSKIQVSDTGNTWTDCDGLTWNGNIFKATITAPSDDYVIRWAKVWFNDTSILCNADDEGPLITLQKDDSTVITYKPNDACKANIKNSSGGGGVVVSILLS